jgi:GxxExxY protein
MNEENKKAENEISREIIGASLDVHRHLGPGLLEKAYEECLSHELALRGVCHLRQFSMPVEYKGHHLQCGFRADFLVEDLVLVEIKAVSSFNDIHRAQCLTYLRLSGKKLCLLMNFNSKLIKDGIERLVWNL